MKPLLLLCALVFPSIARVQIAPLSAAERPTLAPTLGLAVVNDAGQIQSVCPLTRTDVKSDIAGQMARVVVVQHFSNPSPTPIEALYTFPLPHDAAVDGLTFQVGARVIVGEIKKREQAAQIYQQAKNNGQNAALLDQERPNIFTQRVANIAPGQRIRVETSFTQPVIYRAGRYEWEFPTVVGPRFVTPQTSDADKITPPITPQGIVAGHDLTLQIHLQSPVALGEISSVLHPITIDKSGDKEANIALKAGATLPNKDFVLRFSPRDNVLQTGLITRSDGKGGGWFQLTVQPPVKALQAQIASKEMVFVIDQTGSQMGAPLEKAKETMRYCIQNLNPNDTFQLLGFNTSVYPCFVAPVAATPDSIAKALAYLAPLKGGGGTDILKAANYALQIPDDPKRPRIICFMTDGYVGNETDILAWVRDHRQSARMFPFGVGNSVNRYLIDGMAREGRGVPEYALLNENSQELAQRFYQRVANPVLLDVNAQFYEGVPRDDGGKNWGASPVAEVYPKVVPDVYESGPVVLTGRFTRPVAGFVEVSGIAAGRSWKANVPYDFSQADQKGAAGLPSAWARQKIEDLSNARPTEVSSETAADLRQQITDVALDYHLMSPYTSFVAVEPTVVNVGGVQKTVEVPVEMADGVSYEGIFGANGRTPILSSVSQNIGGGGGAGPTNGVPILGDIPLVGGLFKSQTPNAAALPGNIAAVTNVAPVNGLLVHGGSTSHFGVGASLEARTALDVSAERLAKMTPEERLKTIRFIKMSDAVAQLAPQKPAAKVTVQLWLSPLADDKARAEFAAQLVTLGWSQSAILTKDKLILGEISSDKLDELAALEGVRLIELPKFK